MKLTKKYIKSTACALAVVIFQSFTSAQAELKSTSPEEFAQYGPEDAYWVLTATCNDDTQHVVQRKTDGELWCIKDAEEFCDNDKDKAAAKACSDEYRQLEQAKQAERDAQAAERRAARERAARAAEQKAELERQRAAEQAQQEAAIKDQISIEEQLLQIEQEKLALRKQELELQRRAVEIQALLDEEPQQ